MHTQAHTHTPSHHRFSGLFCTCYFLSFGRYSSLLCIWKLLFILLDPFQMTQTLYQVFLKIPTCVSVLTLLNLKQLAPPLESTKSLATPHSVEGVQKNKDLQSYTVNIMTGLHGEVLERATNRAWWIHCVQRHGRTTRSSLDEGRGLDMN